MVSCSTIEIDVIIDTLHLLPVNLSLLASLDERFHCGELNCFLVVENNKFKDFEDNDSANRTTRECWIEDYGFSGRESFILFSRVKLEGFFFCYLYIVILMVILPVAIIDSHCKCIYVLK